MMKRFINWLTRVAEWAKKSWWKISLYILSIALSIGACIFMYNTFDAVAWLPVAVALLNIFIIAELIVVFLFNQIIFVSRQLKRRMILRARKNKK